MGPGRVITVGRAKGPQGGQQQQSGGGGGGGFGLNTGMGATGSNNMPMGANRLAPQQQYQQQQQTQGYGGGGGVDIAAAAAAAAAQAAALASGMGGGGGGYGQQSSSYGQPPQHQQGYGQQPSSSGGGYGGYPQQQQAPSGVPSRVVVLDGMVQPHELLNDGDYADIMEDISGECGKYGQLAGVNIPRPPAPGNGRVFLHYADISGGIAAATGLPGRQFGGKPISARYYDEGSYRMGIYTQ